MNVYIVSSTMFIKLNGVSVANFDPLSFVRSWIAAGNRQSTSWVTGPKATVSDKPDIHQILVEQCCVSRSGFRGSASRPRSPLSGAWPAARPIWPRLGVRPASVRSTVGPAGGPRNPHESTADTHLLCHDEKVRRNCFSRPKMR